MGDVSVVCDRQSGVYGVSFKCDLDEHTCYILWFSFVFVIDGVDHVGTV